MLALVGVFVYLRVASDLSSAIDAGLRSRAIDLAGVVSSAGTEEPRLPGGQDDEEAFSQVLTPSGEVIATTLAPGVEETLDPAEAQRAAEAPLLLDGVEVPGIEGDARILARPASSPAGEFVVVAGASTEDRNEALTGLLGAFAIGAPVALLLAVGLGYLLAGRSLAPVVAMRRRAEEITLERSGERLPLPRADDEIHHLGETLNGMLERLEASLERERVFVADASHELRTPLAILRAELELANRSGRSPEELREALVSAAEEVDRLTQLAEDLLVIARSDRRELPIVREPVELTALLDRVSERFAQRARESDRRISVDAAGGASGEIDPMRIEQALGNLVDNALRHGHGEVRLSARREGSTAVFEVSDDGPGFPAGFSSAAFERFSRGDEGRTGGGAGLGLSIADVIAVAHGGGATIANEDERGATVRLTVRLTE